LVNLEYKTTYIIHKHQRRDTMLTAPDPSEEDPQGLLPEFDQDQFLFDMEFTSLSKAHPIMEREAVKRWLSVVHNILSAHIAWRGGNHWALDAASRQIPAIPEGFTETEIKELEEILAALKEEAGYTDININSDLDLDFD
jgi:hypothetical protein